MTFPFVQNCERYLRKKLFTRNLKITEFRKLSILKKYLISKTFHFSPFLEMNSPNNYHLPTEWILTAFQLLKPLLPLSSNPTPASLDNKHFVRAFHRRFFNSRELFSWCRCFHRKHTEVWDANVTVFVANGWARLKVLLIPSSFAVEQGAIS